MSIHRSLTVGYGLARVGLGLVVLAVPEVVGRTWIGDEADSPPTKVVLRALGVRDLALGAGTVVGASSPDVNVWLATCALADAGDVASTIVGRDSIPKRGVITTVVAASAGAIAGVALIAMNSLVDSDNSSDS